MVAMLSAQTPKPTFEVASVKKRLEPSPRGAASVSRPQGGVFKRPNATVADLVRYAYRVREVQLAGGPDWIHEDRFEIDAKAAGNASPDEMLLMVQSLLEERFALRTHREQREMRFFALVLARSDGRPGPHLHRMKDQCDLTDFNAAEKARPKYSAYMVTGGSCAPIAAFEDTASKFVELPVFDRTGLVGKWAFNVYFAPPDAGPIRLSAPADPNLASFPVALQEQLGLKLEARRGPIDVLVIDSVQPPTEN
jgi:uncharacterized protein (TIGR03435 family)